MNFCGLCEHRGVPASMTAHALRALAVLAATAAVLAGAALPAVAAHGSANVNVLKVLGARIASVKRDDGGVAVLLPATMALPRPDYSAASASKGRYRLEIDGAEPCDGANVCLFALFTGVRGGHPYGKPLALHHGISGRYATIQCAASCSPASIDWVEHGVLYSIEANPSVEDHPGAAAGAVRAAFVAAANRAIEAGPR